MSNSGSLERDQKQI